MPPLPEKSRLIASKRPPFVKAPPPAEPNRLQMLLKRLALGAVVPIVEEEAKKAAKTKMSYTGFLERLLEEELLSKTERGVQMRIQKARFPQIKTLDAFDFSFQPSINQALLNELAELHFLSAATNVLFIGAPGTGKSHLAIALGVKACQAGKSVLFTTVANLLDLLVASTIDRSLPQKLDMLLRVTLLVLDELGYLPMDKQRANLFFQLISRRYEKGSIILTSNKSFDGWGDIFGDDVIAGAILDRLLHHSHVIAINGPSFRTKDKFKSKTKGGNEDDKT